MTIKQQFNTLKESNNQERLKKFYNKYKSIFEMPAKVLCFEIVKVFKENDPTLKVNPVHQVVGNYYEMQQREDKNSNYQNTISTSLAINKNGKVKCIVLCEHSTAANEERFLSANYMVNVFDLLLDDNLEYAEIIHEGCWKAISENLKNVISEHSV